MHQGLSSRFDISQIRLPEAPAAPLISREAPEQPTNLLLDFDGFFASTIRIEIRSIIDVYKQVSGNPDKKSDAEIFNTERFSNTVPHTYEQIAIQHLGLRGDQIQEFLTNLARKQAEELLEASALVVELVPILRALKRKFEKGGKELSIHIITNSIHEKVEPFLRSWRLFQDTAGTSIIESVLDEHRIYRDGSIHHMEPTVTKVQRIKPFIGSNTLTIVIGDTRSDMIQGHEAGAQTILNLWGLTGESQSQSIYKDHIAPTPNHLITLFGLRYSDFQKEDFSIWPPTDDGNVLHVPFTPTSDRTLIQAFRALRLKFAFHFLEKTNQPLPLTPT